MRSPWAGSLAIVLAAWAADAHAQDPGGPYPFPSGQPTPAPYGAAGSYGPGSYGPGPYGPPPEGNAPPPPMFGAVPGPSLACQPTPAMTQGSECVPMLDIRRFYVSADYIAWWFKDAARTPPLVTSGNSNDVIIGALGQPGTTVLFGGSPIDTNAHSGVLVNAGYWLDSELTFAIDGSYFFAGENSKSFRIGSDGQTGSPNIGRPFFNVDPIFPNTVAVEDAILYGANIDGTPVRAGSIYVQFANRLSGGEINLLAAPHLCETNYFRLTFLAGFRVVEFDESLNINTDTTDLPVGTGTHEDEAESFATRNTFYGGQLGANVEFTDGPWILDLKAKVAIGDMHERAKVSGFVTNVDQTTGIVTTGIGGLLTQPSNIGTYKTDVLGCVPEGTITLGYDLTRGINLHVSYNFLYLSRVARSDNIDRNVSIQQVPPLFPVGLANAPVYSFHQTDFWAQGVNVGVSFRF